jgi:hypothetical protein
MSRVGIIGSRGYPLLDRIVHEVQVIRTDCAIVTGAWWDPLGRPSVYPTHGADRAAAWAAKPAHTVVLVAGPSGLGNRAGLFRNPTTVDLSDEIVAFAAWCDQEKCSGRSLHISHGTESTIRYAQGRGKTVIIYGPDGRELAA